MQKANSIIEDNPHEAFNKIYKNKYEILYSTHEDKFETILNAEVRFGDNIVANADFVISEGDLHCNNVRVDEEHRRKGICTALYVFAEKLFGRKIENFWKGDPIQSDAAKKLWNQPNRPFG